MTGETKDNSMPKNGFLSAGSSDGKFSRRLTDDEFDRYSRQMIVPGMGREGQLRLIESRLLIIGAGGLGCPAAQYIAGAGVGTIGIVDGDIVEASNLHRQVGHATSRLGMKKVDSLITHLKALNPLPTYIGYDFQLTPQNAADIISQYDLVLDCTDHPITRYLISDICVLTQKPLVSAAAVQKSGQLTVLNCPPAPQGLVDGEYPPCYRCCFRKPPPPSSMVSCGEAGIMGPVVGMMGIAQAGEAIKILASGLHLPPPTSDDNTAPALERNLARPTLLIYTYDLDSAVGPYSFRALKMGGRKKNCFACGEGSTLTLDGIKTGNPDYVQFCSAPTINVKLPPERRITAVAYHAARGKGELPGHILVDTREKEHFSFGSLEGAVNMPFGRFLMNAAAVKRSGGSARDLLPTEAADGDAPIFVVCRTGQDSQETVEKLRELGLDNGGQRKIVDIMGGLRAWKQDVDPTFPFI
ncbi:hypothetical protein B0J18DRAFT_244509 [Chaetomium sp. MPI-SDFR-AT-0129]|nr:hypothetical protein B0J18DRAFT_244509 [Chaetomium sp. MPI-SDFR-AT-0129]